MIYAAALEDERDAEYEQAPLFRERNVLVPVRLAEWCRERGTAFLLPSSDRVFDGRRDAPCRESDPTSPRDSFGRSRAEAESKVREARPTALIARSGPLFGPWDDDNFLTAALRELAAGHSVSLPDSARVSPTYLPDFVHAALDLLIDGEAGLWHLANDGAATRAEFAARAALKAGLNPAGIGSHTPRSPAATRPACRVVQSERATLLPPLESALDCYLRDCGVNWAQVRAARQATDGESVRSLRTDAPETRRKLVRSQR